MKIISLCLVLLLRLSQSLMAQIPLGTYKTQTGDILFIGEIESNPVIIYNKGEIRGLRPIATPNTFEVGNATGLFEKIEGQFQVSAAGNAKLTMLGTEITATKMSHIEREVSFKNQKTTLAGTLILPEGIGPFPCIVFTHGSGPETRESNRGLANLFAANGIASLIYDKRGTGKSSGKDWQDSFDNYAADAIAGAEFLNTQSTINSKKIGLYGHSQGGWITPLAVSKTNLFSFAIISAANAVSPVEQHLAAGDEEYRLTSMDETTLQEVHAFRLLKYEVGITGKKKDEFKKTLAEVEKKPWFKTTGGALPESPFWKANGFYDPAPALKAMSCPVLVLYGELDISTNVQRNLPLMKKLIGSKDVDYRVFENTNHMMMKVNKKGYATKQLPFVTQFADGYIDTLVSWVMRFANN